MNRTSGTLKTPKTPTKRLRRAARQMALEALPDQEHTRHRPKNYRIAVLFIDLWQQIPEEVPDIRPSTPTPLVLTSLYILHEDVPELRQPQGLPKLQQNVWGALRTWQSRRRLRQHVNEAGVKVAAMNIMDVLN